jgi:hypothetical protein
MEVAGLSSMNNTTTVQTPAEYVTHPLSQFGTELEYQQTTVETPPTLRRVSTSDLQSIIDVYGPPNVPTVRGIKEAR